MPSFPATPVEAVIVGAGAQFVAPRSAPHGVLATVVVDHVAPATPIDHVVPALPFDLVLTAEATR